MELINATLKNLITERLDLVEDIKAGRDQGSSSVVVTKDDHNRMKIWTETIVDIDSIETSRRIDIYSYYKTHEIDVINQKQYINNELISEVGLKHYLDGRQPDVSNIGIDKKVSF